MAIKKLNEITVTPETPTTTGSQREQALTHLANLESQMIELYGGKPGMNAWMWLRDNVRPLLAEIHNTPEEKSSELYTKALSLKVVEPKVN